MAANQRWVETTVALCATLGLDETSTSAVPRRSSAAAGLREEIDAALASSQEAENRLSADLHAGVVAALTAFANATATISAK